MKRSDQLENKKYKVFGDKVLVEVAKRLQTISAKEKDVARISGDEFIIVVHDFDSIINAENVAKEIKGLFEQPFTIIESKTRDITASIGVIKGSGRGGRRQKRI
ncbi:MAG: diguanylate cyclase [Bacillus sp. (in: firmicutes)]